MCLRSGEETIEVERQEEEGRWTVFVVVPWEGGEELVVSRGCQDLVWFLLKGHGWRGF